MTTNTKIISTVAGNTSVVSGELAYLPMKDIIMVKREGVQYDIIDEGTPVNRQVLYTASKGKLTFGTPHTYGAKVYVLYQH